MICERVSINILCILHLITGEKTELMPQKHVMGQILWRMCLQDGCYYIEVLVSIFFGLTALFRFLEVRVIFVDSLLLLHPHRPPSLLKS